MLLYAPPNAYTRWSVHLKKYICNNTKTGVYSIPILHGVLSHIFFHDNPPPSHAQSALALPDLAHSPSGAPVRLMHDLHYCPLDNPHILGLCQMGLTGLLLLSDTII